MPLRPLPSLSAPSVASISSLAIGLTLALSPAGCSSSTTEPTSSSGAVAGSITKDVGPEGGVIEVEGATVTFPKGALGASTSITIRAKSGGAPEGYTVLSKVFECEPSGTTFAQPVTMKMPFTSDGKSTPTMFWSTKENPAFTDVGGTAEGGFVIATVKHFSSGFVAARK